MLTYELVRFPNQRFDTNVGSRNFDFTLRTFRGIIYVTLRIDGELTAAGIRATPNASLFSEPVNRIAGGEFRFVCQTEDYPSHEDFDGVRCVFAFIPEAERGERE